MPLQSARGPRWSSNIAGSLHPEVIPPFVDASRNARAAYSCELAVIEAAVAAAFVVGGMMGLIASSRLAWFGSA